MYMRSLWSPHRSSVPVSDFLSVQRALRHAMLEDAFAVGSETPAKRLSLDVQLDVREDEHAFRVYADLPGLDQKDVEVTFDDGLLTISGEKKTQIEAKTDKAHLSERSYGSFARKLTLKAKIDASKIEAKFENGVLSVSLPKLAPEKPTAQKIQITTP